MIAGLTGGIGSGKSVVAKLFGMLGCAVFNSDEAARTVYFRGDIKEAVITLLGREAYAGEREINKAYISAKVFGNAELLRNLNAIIHPAVGDMFRDFAVSHREQVVIKESALLFEANVADGLDRIIVVTAPEKDRIARVMRRDNATREEVLKRLASQLSQEEKARRADYVIRNDENHLLISQVESIFTLLSAG